jgi:hypothetical protein
MPIQIIINAANANANNFVIVDMPATPFTIDAKVSGITGSPTWSLMVSNVGTTEADFKNYSVDTTNMPITTAIESAKLNYAFVAVKFVSNSSTGTYSFYIGN